MTSPTNDDGKGRWVTLKGGSHVYIVGGRIARGPAGLVGKGFDELSRRKSASRARGSHATKPLTRESGNATGAKLLQRLQLLTKDDRKGDKAAVDQAVKVAGAALRNGVRAWHKETMAALQEEWGDWLKTEPGKKALSSVNNAVDDQLKNAVAFANQAGTAFGRDDDPHKTSYNRRTAGEELPTAGDYLMRGLEEAKKDSFDADAEDAHAVASDVLAEAEDFDGEPDEDQLAEWAEQLNGTGWRLYKHERYGWDIEPDIEATPRGGDEKPVTFAFDPNQPRDGLGRWTVSGAAAHHDAGSDAEAEHVAAAVATHPAFRAASAGHAAIHAAGERRFRGGREARGSADAIRDASRELSSVLSTGLAGPTEDAAVEIAAATGRDPDMVRRWVGQVGKRFASYLARRAQGNALTSDAHNEDGGYRPVPLSPWSMASELDVAIGDVLGDRQERQPAAVLDALDRHFLGVVRSPQHRSQMALPYAIKSFGTDESRDRAKTVQAILRRPLTVRPDL